MLYDLIYTIFATKTIIRTMFEKFLDEIFALIELQNMEKKVEAEHNNFQ